MELKQNLKETCLFYPHMNWFNGQRPKKTEKEQGVVSL